MPRRYPAEFRRKVLDLVAAGRPVAQVAHDLDISAQVIYTYGGSGQIPGMNSTDHAKLVAAASGSPSWRTSWRSTAGPPSCSAMWCPQKPV